MLPDECIRIFDDQKAIEGKEKQQITYYKDHLKAKATILKGLREDGGREPEPRGEQMKFQDLS